MDLGIILEAVGYHHFQNIKCKRIFDGFGAQMERRSSKFSPDKLQPKGTL